MKKERRTNPRTLMPNDKVRGSTNILNAYIFDGLKPKCKKPTHYGLDTSPNAYHKLQKI